MRGKTITKGLVWGVGTMDVPNGSACPMYYKWKAILARTENRCPSIIEEFPNYKDCTLDPRWHTYSVFKEWVESFDDWENKHIDKDLLVEGNKHYGPDTCLMVRGIVNAAYKKFVPQKNGLPTGIDYNPYYLKQKSKNPNTTYEKKYRVQINILTKNPDNTISSKRTHLGFFRTLDEALFARGKTRLEQMKVVVETETDEIVRNAIIKRESKIAKQLQKNPYA
tara:strand:+ start:198 stop:866 length:669 start_codon:yes stop_codon:yes gene_type:complete